VLRLTGRCVRATVAVVLALIAGTLIAGTLIAPAAPAWADAPTRLADQVTDRVGAIGGQRAQVDAALRDLREAAGLQLFVVFVSSFDGVPAQEWADRTARLSDLGRNDALLAVAIHDRSYAYNVDTASRLTNEELDNVARQNIEPALARNDWAGAVVAAARGYQLALQDGGNVAAPRLQGTRASGATSVVVFLCFAVVLAVIGLVVWLVLRARKRSRAAPTDPNDPHPGVSTEQLSAKANTLLVELDDSLRVSQRELDLATAEFGAPATASFTAALGQARDNVAEAFRLRMLLEEATPAQGAPADEAGRRKLLAGIIAQCEQADAALDAESDAFDALRELETNLDQASAKLTERLAAVRTRAGTAPSEVDELKSRFAGPALAAVADNPAQVTERVHFAESSLAQSTTEAGAGDRAAAAVALRAAEQAVDQAETLLAAITRARTDLDAAAAGVTALLAEVRADLVAARTAQTAGGANPEAAGTLAVAVSQGEQSVATAEAALRESTVDPIDLGRQLRDADAALDRALAQVRDATEQAARARAVLGHAMQAAQAEIASATDYLSTRRGAVAERARTLLAEASRHLGQAQAVAATDPVTALMEAQQADRLAEQASQSARSDVDSWGGGGSGLGGFGGGVAGAVLGGIILGGNRRGGFGGSSRRGGGGRF
jgi:uncharacterized membrane protein YgcG